MGVARFLSFIHRAGTGSCLGPLRSSDRTCEDPRPPHSSPRPAPTPLAAAAWKLLSLPVSPSLQLGGYLSGIKMNQPFLLVRCAVQPRHVLLRAGALARPRLFLFALHMRVFQSCARVSTLEQPNHHRWNTWRESTGAWRAGVKTT